jgi:hypothetical protein
MTGEIKEAHPPGGFAQLCEKLRSTGLTAVETLQV